MERLSAQHGIAIDDPDIKRKYERYKESVMEWNSIIATAKDDAIKEGLAEGRAEGLAEGRAEGVREERERMAAKLKELGVDQSIITEALSN